MWTKFLKRFSRVTHSESGQGILEYLLVTLVIVGMVIVFAKPFMSSLSKKLTTSMNTGFFNDDGSGSSFYSFSVK